MSLPVLVVGAGRTSYPTWTFQGDRLGQRELLGDPSGIKWLEVSDLVDATTIAPGSVMDNPVCEAVPTLLVIVVPGEPKGILVGADASPSRRGGVDVLLPKEPTARAPDPVMSALGSMVPTWYEVSSVGALQPIV